MGDRVQKILDALAANGYDPASENPEHIEQWVEWMEGIEKARAAKAVNPTLEVDKKNSDDWHP